MNVFPKIKNIDIRINVTTYHSVPLWYKYIPVLNMKYYEGPINRNDVFRRTWNSAYACWKQHLYREIIMKYRYEYIGGKCSLKSHRFSKLLK